MENYEIVNKVDDLRDAIEHKLYVLEKRYKDADTPLDETRIKRETEQLKNVLKYINDELETYERMRKGCEKALDKIVNRAEDSNSSDYSYYNGAQTAYANSLYQIYLIVKELIQ